MQWLCLTDEVPEGEGRAFVVERAPDDKLEVLVVHIGEQFLAYENACAHFGVRLDVSPDYRFVDKKEIVCQVHYARYDVFTGECTKGDCANAGLRPLSIRLEDKNIYLQLV